MHSQRVNHYGIKNFNWVGGTFLLLSPIAALILTYLHVAREGFVWQIWVLAIAFYGLTVCSITGGYHRYFAHKTYEARPWLQWFWALFGAAAFQNSIYIWARDHRIHHRFVDTDKDPYSINRGFFFAHMGWMLAVDDQPVDPKPYGRDFDRAPIVMFQHKHYAWIATAMGVLLPTLIGWALGSWLGGLAVAGLLRIVTVHHVTFCINSWCHMFGHHTYTNKQTARDSGLMALVTFGEGYHNFHHQFDLDYRNGVRWYHWDPTKWVIQMLSWVGATSKLKRTPWSEIIKMQMAMDEQRLKHRLMAQQRWQQQLQIQMDALRLKVEQTQLRFEQLKSDYRTLAQNYADSSRAKLNELKLQYQLARIERKAAFKKWRTFLAAAS